MRRFINYFREVRIELSKVVWPKKQEVIRLTLIVLLISALVAAYVGGADFLLTKALGFLVTK